MEGAANRARGLDPRGRPCSTLVSRRVLPPAAALIICYTWPVPSQSRPGAPYKHCTVQVLYCTRSVEYHEAMEHGMAGVCSVVLHKWSFDGALSYMSVPSHRSRLTLAAVLCFGPAMEEAAGSPAA